MSMSSSLKAKRVGALSSLSSLSSVRMARARRERERNMEEKEKVKEKRQLPASFRVLRGADASRGRGVERCLATRTDDAGVDVDQLNQTAKKERIQALTEQLKHDLMLVRNTFDNPIFTNALIAGDVVILDVLHKCGLLGGKAF